MIFLDTETCGFHGPTVLIQWSRGGDDPIKLHSVWESPIGETLALIESGNAKKGDVLGVARIAGIQGAKKTSELIPLCHPLPLSKVSIEFLLNKDRHAVEITATVKVTGKTGVEMEALTAVTISALTIYDMVKAVDKKMVISHAYVATKEGGKSGALNFDGNL